MATFAVSTAAPARLRELFLFESLSDERLERLARLGGEWHVPAGATVFEEGRPAELFVVLLSGTLVLSRRLQDDELETTRTDQRGVYMGATQAVIGDTGETGSRYRATLRAAEDCVFFVLPAVDFAALVRQWYPMAVHLLEGLFVGMTTAQAVVGQRERLVALGTLTTGLMRELNTAADAAVGATTGLRQQVAGLRGTLRMVADGRIDRTGLRTRLDRQESAIDELVAGIHDADARIFALVGAAKQYVHLDRAAHQLIDVHEGLDSTLVMVRHRIGAGVRVVVDYDRALPRIPGYPAELNQVWTHLIDNAVQAMDGTGTLTVRTARDGDRVLVEVGDTGPGVPTALAGRIFEPFYTTRPLGQGSGLGLDISSRIVAGRHHGDLTFVSRPGDTRFQVRLPIAEGGAAAPSTTDGMYREAPAGR